MQLACQVCELSADVKHSCESSVRSVARRRSLVHVQSGGAPAIYLSPAGGSGYAGEARPSVETLACVSHGTSGVVLYQLWVRERKPVCQPTVQRRLAWALPSRCYIHVWRPANRLFCVDGAQQLRPRTGGLLPNAHTTTRKSLKEWEFGNIRMCAKMCCVIQCISAFRSTSQPDAKAPTKASSFDKSIHVWRTCFVP